MLYNYSVEKIVQDFNTHTLTQNDYLIVAYQDGEIALCQAINTNRKGNGDIVVVRENKGTKVQYQIGETRLLKYGNNPLRTIYKLNNVTRLVGGESRQASVATQPTNPMGENGPVRKLSNALQRNLPGKMKTLYKAGYLDESLELTKEGRRVLREISLEAFEDKMVERAKEEMAEREEETKKSK